MIKVIISTILLLSITYSVYSQNREIITVEINKTLLSEIGEAVVSTGEIIRNDGQNN
tara:strand:+ start:1515 stop:1685 length:171 start_codon:yes stop_codon:yes gene_type:complete